MRGVVVQNMESEASTNFVNNIEKLLLGEEVDLYESGISASFEYACSSLFESIRERGIWYDGITNIEIRRRKRKQLELTGHIWVAKGASKQWLESFHAVVTDKRVTKQGMWLSVDIGEYHSEGNIYELI